MHGKFRVDRELTRRIAAGVAFEMLRLEREHDESSPQEILERYNITTKIKQLMAPGRIHGLLNECTTLCESYEKLIEQWIAPHIVEKFVREGQQQQTPIDDSVRKAPARKIRHDFPSPIHSDTRYVVLYQYPPTVRIYCSHLPKLKGGDGPTKGPPGVNSMDAKYRNLGRFHCDAQYGHQDGEVNFWMPLTRIDESSTLWAESEPAKADWYPFAPMVPGEIWQFPGSNCRHFTRPNVSGTTRVSLDFRCSTARCFDETWRLPGMNSFLRQRHRMRKIAVRVVPSPPGEKLRFECTKVRQREG
eukprot:g3112.t1